MDATTPRKIKIRIGDDTVELDQATEGQLLGLAMLESGAFDEAQQTLLLMKAIVKLIPESHRVAFVDQFTSGGYGAKDLAETFRQIVGAGGVQEEPRNREERRTAGKKTAAKRPAKRAAASR